MSFYLVDFENVNSDGLKGIDKLDENDSVVIFYSEKADKISFEIYNELKASKAEIKLKKVTVGQKNALDFQLAAYLGYSAAKNGDDAHFIVSNDNGYNVLCGFWKNVKVNTVCNIEKGINLLGRQSAQKAAEVRQQTEQKTAAKSTIMKYEVIIKQHLTLQLRKNAIVHYISGIISDEQEIEYIVKCVDDNFEKLKKGTEKSKFNNLLCRRYGSETGGEIYRAVQTFYKEYSAAKVPEDKIQEIINKESEIEWIAGCITETHIKTAKDEQKKSVHNSIQGKYGNDIGSKIYKAIRSVI